MKPFKPHDLVYVTVADDYCEQRRRGYIGEVISYETPNHTIMVRRVPGDPTTMEELPVTALNKARSRYIHYAMVSGHGCFPSDMLRYDSCVPVNFRIEPAYSGAKAVLEEGQTAFVVARCSDRRTSDYTEARWNSFWWRVIPLKTTKIGSPS
jgi:hypothetical protein